MIQDPQGKNRPVYTVNERSVSLWLPRADGGYEHEETYASIEDLKETYPDAVKNVFRRDEPNRRRHPDVHFRPSGLGVYCRKYLATEATLQAHQLGNAQTTTDVAKVTCKTCLKAIVSVVRRIA